MGLCRTFYFITNKSQDFSINSKNYISEFWHLNKTILELKMPIWGKAKQLKNSKPTFWASNMTQRPKNTTSLMGVLVRVKTYFQADVDVTVEIDAMKEMWILILKNFGYLLFFKNYINDLCHGHCFFLLDNDIISWNWRY